MRTTAVRSIRITHRSSGEVIAEGPLGFWGITPFEGNLYISRKCLKTSHLRPNWVPGLCIYKFLFLWLDLRLPNGTSEPVLAAKSAFAVHSVSTSSSSPVPSATGRRDHRLRQMEIEAPYSGY